MVLDAALTPKLADFGLSASSASGSGRVGGGTLAFMAPEVLRHDAIPEAMLPAVDVYGLGCVSLFHFLFVVACFFSYHLSASLHSRLCARCVLRDLCRLSPSAASRKTGDEAPSGAAGSDDSLEARIAGLRSLMRRCEEGGPAGGAADAATSDQPSVPRSPHLSAAPHPFADVAASCLATAAAARPRAEAACAALSGMAAQAARWGADAAAGEVAEAARGAEKLAAAGGGAC